MRREALYPGNADHRSPGSRIAGHLSGTDHAAGRVPIPGIRRPPAGTPLCGCRRRRRPADDRSRRMTRLLLDQGLAPRSAGILRERGMDAVHVSVAGMERATDIQILEVARAEERVCVTLDHDFHAHLALTGQGRPSVVLRVQGLAAKGVADLIQPVCLTCAAALSEGAAISADGDRIRVRRLPLRQPRTGRQANLTDKELHSPVHFGYY
jgi:predicted nuclease of predicted toxin-antitoxin system